MKFFYFILLYFLPIIISCNSSDCNQLPKTYGDYNEAVNKIRSAHFKIKETINTSRSTWIRGAEYYSCDGKTGFFIIITDKKEYLHAGLPVDVWFDFKNAESFGRFYNKNIKHRYFFKPN